MPEQSVRVSTLIWPSYLIQIREMACAGVSYLIGPLMDSVLIIDLKLMPGCIFFKTPLPLGISDDLPWGGYRFFLDDSVDLRRG